MSAPPSPTLSDAELLDSVEASFDLGAERERRMAELRATVESARHLKETEYGRVVTYTDEKELVERLAKEKYCVLHFMHPDFPKCKIMDERLAELAPKYKHTLLLRVSVADIPFLVGKFSIQVLPCVYAFVDGKKVDRLVGFEDLGNTDTFTAKTLEFRLKQSGVLVDSLTLASLLPAGARRSGSDDESDEDDERAFRDKASRRKGKVGIRNGLASRGGDDDEW
ncbi:Thioredoxin domain-containing protein plp1 [Vanrija pseudolonga]|uniref:Thioredoxin domain-containing protein plp1 n=1 Tax=Vanrija pseudolonga TaxID=143232 RepID=A0AAF1BGT3_9TREE|nr:Thioredoxin domain-containing protein plp1 [Vanrija pseudolonga]